MRLETLTHEHGAFQETLESMLQSLFAFEEGTLLELITHFIYDLIRTFGVFLIVLFIVSYLKTYIPVGSVRKALASLNPLAAIFIASLAGLISSTCICTNVPLFLGLLAFGVPLSLSMTYLISTSLLNLSSLISMAALVGLKFAWIYIITSFVIVFITGVLISGIKSENLYLNKAALPNDAPASNGGYSQNQRLNFSLHEVRHTFKDQWGYLLIGVALSAIIVVFIDLDVIQALTDSGFAGVLAVTSAGLVLHTDVIALLPIVSTLVKFNTPYAVLFALVASFAFFSIPMVIMVKKAVHIKYIAIIWAIMYVLILVAGGILLLAA